MKTKAQLQREFLFKAWSSVSGKRVPRADADKILSIILEKVKKKYHYYEGRYVSERSKVYKAGLYRGLLNIVDSILDHGDVVECHSVKEEYATFSNKVKAAIEFLVPSKEQAA